MNTKSLDDRAKSLLEAYKLGGRSVNDPEGATISERFRHEHAGDAEVIAAFDRGLTDTQKSRLYEGMLIEHGAAPYKHQPGQRPNYFVRIATVSGAKTVWGVDLAAALERADAQPGQWIRLEHSGADAVVVETPTFDASGVVTGSKQGTSLRNQWKISVIPPAVALEHLASAPHQLAQSDRIFDATLGSPSSNDAFQSPVSGRRLHSAMSPTESFMHGAGGVRGLMGLTGIGAAAITKSIRELQYDRAAKAYRDAIGRAEALASDFSQRLNADDSAADVGLTHVIADLESEDPRFAHARIQLEEAVKQLPQIAEKLIESMGRAGRAAQSTPAEIVEPINQFSERHKLLLEALGGNTAPNLYEHLQSAVDALMAKFIELIERVVDALKPGSPGPAPR